MTEDRSEDWVYGQSVLRNILSTPEGVEVFLAHVSVKEESGGMTMNVPDEILERYGS